MSKQLIEARHPEHMADRLLWVGYQLAYDGGTRYIRDNLVKGVRESTADYNNRMELTHCPNICAQAVEELRDALFQRMVFIQRNGGSSTYHAATEGQLDGVDLRSSKMDSFIGLHVVPQLLIKRRVGVLVDMPQDIGQTLADIKGKHPYINVYNAEQILNWTTDARGEYTSLLLGEVVDELDQLYNFPLRTIDHYRYFVKTPEGVTVSFFDTEGVLIASYPLQIDRIPFVLFEISRSILKDAHRYQRVIMNLESTEAMFCFNQNHPLYYEFYDASVEGIQLRGYNEENNDDGIADDGENSKEVEIQIGHGRGRRFPKDLSAPGYTSPNPETLKVSMEKVSQLKREMREIINLNVLNVLASRVTSNAKVDREGLENKMACLGDVLETGEQRIANMWAMFEGSTPAVIKYPDNYGIQKPQDVLDANKGLFELADLIPSPEFRREVSKVVARRVLQGFVSNDDMQRILGEIASVQYPFGVGTILESLKIGAITNAQLEEALGLPKGTMNQAMLDRAERAARIAEAQGGLQNASAARGVPEVGGKDGKEEKE